MISIALATYNGEKYIKKQLLSIINQSIKPQEIVICDDLSTDDTIKIINEIKNKYKNISFNIIVNNEKLGFCDNFLKAIFLCKGDYIFLSDQDDVFHKNKIELMYNELINNNKIKLLYSNNYFIDKNDKIILKNLSKSENTLYYYENNETIKKEELKKAYNLKKFTDINFFIKYNTNNLININFKRFLKSVAFSGNTFAFKRELLNDILLLKEKNIKFNYHDLLLSYLAQRKNGLYFYNKKITYYRMHGDNTIGVNEVNDKKKVDRVMWLQNIINIQKELLLYEQNIDKINRGGGAYKH
ncbi:MAG: glycosyltransferase [Eubacteriales bacterium]|nr:glycosyltransferase [Eubacteriales bacterium]